MNQSNRRGATPAGAPLIRPYMPELDSVRGLAILLVLLLHGAAPPLKAQLSGWGKLFFEVSEHGGVGVNLFFVLSGFLITGILFDSRGNADYFRRFYIRRALRILPAFYATLFFLLIGGWISWRFAALSVFFLANATPLMGVPLQYGPLWSLAVEEHFYLLWPSVVRKLSSRPLALAAVLVVGVTPGLREIAFLSGKYTQAAPLYTWFNADGLALGALLALWLRQPGFCRSHLSRVAFPLLAAGLLGCAFVWYEPSFCAALQMTCRDIGCAGWLSCMLLLGTSRWRFLADVPFLKFLGFISYGLYLVHVLSFRIVEIVFSRQFVGLISSGSPTTAMFLRFLAGSALAITIAYLSRRSLEERFLRMGFASRATEVPAKPEEKQSAVCGEAETP